ncbi:MAG: hypothetical protein ACLTDX_02140 [[Clostridium] innocuum]
MTINLISFCLAQNGRYSSMIENGWQNGKEKTKQELLQLMEINGEHFQVDLNTIKNDDYG